MIILNGKIQFDENGDTLYYNHYSAGFKTANNIECESNKFYMHIIKLGFSGFSENIDTINSLKVSMSVFEEYSDNAKIFNLGYSSTFSGKVYLDKENKICYGELEAMLYNIEKIDGKYYLIDSIQLKNCVFDYKYDEIKNGEIEQ